LTARSAPMHLATALVIVRLMSWSTSHAALL
jgi:hypothetical protein